METQKTYRIIHSRQLPFNSMWVARAIRFDNRVAAEIWLGKRAQKFEGLGVSCKWNESGFEVNDSRLGIQKYRIGE